MVWPFLMAFSALLAVVAWGVGNGPSLRCALAVFGGLVAIRLALLLPVSHNYDILLISAIWVIVAAMMPRQVVRALLVLNGATGIWAKVTDAPRVVGSAPYVAGDLLLIAAMLCIGWSMRHDVAFRLSDISARARSMVGNPSFGHSRLISGGRDAFRRAEGQKVSQQKVNDNG